MSRRSYFHPAKAADMPPAPASSWVSELRNSTIKGELPPEPELRLMAMILEDAINCYLRLGTAKSATAQREYRDAERWLFSERNDWIFSCENICSHLGVAASFVRGRLQAQRDPDRGADENGRDSIDRRASRVTALR